LFKKFIDIEKRFVIFYCSEHEIGTMDKYEIIIYWSHEDCAYVAEVPELPGCMAHGNTKSDALANIDTAIQLWIDTAKEFGDPIPEPVGRRLMYA
jgi:predicted RNase H-like HicB family nuclease